MRIHRSHPEANFTQIPDSTLRDPRLSWRARGILCEILSRPDNWDTGADKMWRRARQDRKEPGEGRAAVRDAFRELEQAGYLRRVRERLPGGQWGTVVHVYDTPVVVSVAEFLDQA